jgi:hypothetical protein
MDTKRQAWLLYLQGIRLQMEYEVKVKQDPNASNIDMLESIRRDNQRLYDYMISEKGEL